MKDNLKELIDSLKSGKYENPAKKIAELAAALKANGGAAVVMLVSLLSAPQISLRLAAIEACRGRQENLLIGELVKLAADTDVRVRRKIIEILPAVEEKHIAQILSVLLKNSETEVRVSAINASGGKRSALEIQRQHLLNDKEARVRLAAAQALATQSDFLAADTLMAALGADSNDSVQKTCADLLEKRLQNSAADRNRVLQYEFSLIVKASRNLNKIGASKYPRLAKCLSAQEESAKNPDEDLSNFGVVLTAAAADKSLPRAWGVDGIVEAALDILLGEKPRSLVLLGESGVGKTAIVNELVYALAKPENGAWRVLRISPTEFLTDTKFLGEWETRLKNLLQVIRLPRRVVLFVPSLSDLSSIGRHGKSDANVAAALAPYIEEGSVLVIGESTPVEYEQGLGAVSSLNRLFAKMLVPEADHESTIQILRRVRDDSGCDIPDSTIDELLEMSNHYFSRYKRPGNAVALLRSIIGGRSEDEAPITSRTMLEVISQSTGIPVDFLDDAIPLDMEEVHSFFNKRVMGQPEAVAAASDLMALIKSGLTDPDKPMGVLLFLGPTGVGKTELARAIAEFVFGDTARLLRFDMSEFASFEGFERLIGVKHRQGLLTDAVRQKPFSVVLLDEIEKSHVNVFDLCLQLFDAGRLTDGQGRTVDFRRTILIMTSNIGVAAKGPIPGFNRLTEDANSVQESRNERAMRDLSRFFRPEFLNRIDRIINFRPLALDVAESIARREVDAVLQRKGIARRNLVIDVDPSVLALLVKEGYSVTFGARPLKRAVERVLLLPLAKAIATGRISGKTTLRVTAAGDRIEVKIVEKAAALQEPQGPRVETDLREQVDFLVEGFHDLAEEIVPLADRKSELLTESQSRDFYQDAKYSAEVFEEIHRLDQYLSTCEGFGKVIQGVQSRLRHRLSKNEEASLRERIEQLASELSHLQFVASSDDARDLTDVLLCLRQVDRKGEGANGVEALTNMYSAFARRRRLAPEILSDLQRDGEDCVCLQVFGLGAHALFKKESGLHELSCSRESEGGKNGRPKRDDREIVRVDVFSVPARIDKSFFTRLKVDILPSKIKETRFLSKPLFEVALFHEPSVRSFRGILSGPKEDALDRAERIAFCLSTQSKESADDAHRQIVRSYELGAFAKIKDTRSGKTITRVGQVLKGNMDALIGR